MNLWSQSFEGLRDADMPPKFVDLKVHEIIETRNCITFGTNPSAGVVGQLHLHLRRQHGGLPYIQVLDYTVQRHAPKPDCA